MTVLNETSDRSPALAWFYDNLAIAWKGNGNNRINLMISRDGQNWTNKVTLGESTFHAPALTGIEDYLYLAWTGTDRYARINVLSFLNDLSPGPLAKVTIPQDSRYGPAIASVGDDLYIAWTGVDRSSLMNVIRSRDGGGSWTDKVTLIENSIAAPALATVVDSVADEQNPFTLYLGWTGTDHPNHLNLLSSKDGQTFTNKTILNMSTLTSLPNREAISLTGPALTTRYSPDYLCPVLDIAWTTRGDQRLACTAYPQPKGGAKLKINQAVSEFTDTSIAAPALGQFDQGLDRGVVTYIAWTGTDGDHHLNVAPLSTLNPV